MPATLNGINRQNLSVTCDHPTNDANRILSNAVKLDGTGAIARVR